MMRTGGVFWAIILIVAGILFLLGNFGVLDVNVWSLLWPLFLIGLGAWIAFGVLRPQRQADLRPGIVPLDGAKSASLKIHHGAGELKIGSGASAAHLVEGEFGGGFELKSERRGEVLVARLGVPGGVIAVPFNWAPGSLDWNVRLNAGVAIELECETGASKSTLDLSELKVTKLKLETGASATDVVLPARAGYTSVEVEAGAAAVDIKVPGGVAARIHTESGLAAINVDPTRFPGGNNRFESPDYASATNRVDIDIEAGVGLVTVS